jgi:hypothetical protein
VAGRRIPTAGDSTIVRAKVGDIARAILVLRGHKVLLDEDLAALYGVETKVLIQAVKRNAARFPQDFMFQLITSEWTALSSQIVTSNAGRGGCRSAPYAFTEQGVAMLSSVLGSELAIAVNIKIMPAFVRRREMLISNHDLAKRLDQLEGRLDKKLQPESRTCGCSSAEMGSAAEFPLQATMASHRLMRVACQFAQSPSSEGEAPAGML